MFVLVGWGLALVCIFGVYIVHGGNIGVILKALPFEMITIFGAAIGAFLANNQMKVVKASISGLRRCFKGSKFSKARYMELLALMFDILQKARKEGLMSIEADVEDPHNSALFKKYPTVGYFWNSALLCGSSTSFSIDISPSLRAFCRMSNISASSSM